MFKNEERDLQDLKKAYNEISVPDNINQYIQAGIREGRKQKYTKKRTKIIFSLATSFLIFSLVILIRVSPVFAAYVSQIPGFEAIVNLINYDKGLQLAVENDFIQPIGLSDEHEDLKFTVDSIIIDESRMVLFYTIENKGDHRFINLSSPSFSAENRERLRAGVSYSSFIDKDMKEYKKLQGRIDVHFPMNDGQEIPDEIYFETKIRESFPHSHDKPINVADDYKEPDLNELNSVWNIKIPIDKTKFEGMKDIYEINQTVEIEGQNINFEQLTIFPTRIALKVSFDQNNSKKIFSFDDLKIVDEKGQEFASITNGITASFVDENTYILYLQSNYFTKPKELYLKATSLQALEKDKLEILLNLEKASLERKPDDRLALESVKLRDEKINLVFSLKLELPQDEKRAYFVFSGEYSDSSGKKYNSLGSSSSVTFSEEEGYNQNSIYYEIENKEYNEPLKLRIEQYPTRINGVINIKVK